MSDLKDKLTQMLELFGKEQMNFAYPKIEYEIVEEKLKQIFECKAPKITYASKNEIKKGKLENSTGFFLFSDSEVKEYYPFTSKEHKNGKAKKFTIPIMYRDSKDCLCIDKELIEEYFE